MVFMWRLFSAPSRRRQREAGIHLFPTNNLIFMYQFHVVMFLTNTQANLILIIKRTILMYQNQEWDNSCFPSSGHESVKNIFISLDFLLFVCLLIYPFVCLSCTTAIKNTLCPIRQSREIYLWNTTPLFIHLLNFGKLRLPTINFTSDVYPPRKILRRYVTFRSLRYCKFQLIP